MLRSLKQQERKLERRRRAKEWKKTLQEDSLNCLRIDLIVKLHERAAFFHKTIFVCFVNSRKNDKMFSFAAYHVAMVPRMAMAMLTITKN